MSSTNRSDARDTHVSDYYVTPLHTIKEFLAAFGEDWDGRNNGPKPCMEPVSILDPCAGGDKDNAMAYPNAIKNHSGWNVSGITTVDCRPDSRAEFKYDYLDLKMDGHGPFDIAITNPPFNIALDVIRKCFTDVRDGGLVIMLLRLNFFGSRERQSFFHNNMPVLTYVHVRRPKFLNTGGTDSIEYCHMVWQKGNPCKFTQMRII